MPSLAYASARAASLYWLAVGTCATPLRHNGGSQHRIVGLHLRGRRPVDAVWRKIRDLSAGERGQNPQLGKARAARPQDARTGGLAKKSQDLSVCTYQKAVSGRAVEVSGQWRSTQTQASYQARLDRVVDHIYAHLDEEIRPKGLPRSPASRLIIGIAFTSPCAVRRLAPRSAGCGC